MTRRLWLVIGLLAACGDNDSKGPFDVRPSVAQLQVTHAPPSTELEVVDATGARAAVGTTDELGSLMFRGLAAAPGYHVCTTQLPADKNIGPHKKKTNKTSTVDPSFYSKQTLVAGNQY